MGAIRIVLVTPVFDSNRRKLDHITSVEVRFISGYKRIFAVM